MKFRTIVGFLAIAGLTADLLGAKDTPDQQRQKIRKMADATLADLYKLEPGAQAAIQKSAGYAIFNNIGTNLLLLSTARGAGIAVHSKNKQDTFMKMFSAGGGIGIGVKDYRVVFVFETEQALAHFIDSGWSGETEADAAAKTSKSGGATDFDERDAAFSPDMRWVAYTSTESGRDEIYVRPFVAAGASGLPSFGEGKWQISRDGGNSPKWRTDGKEIAFQVPPGGTKKWP